ncbi:MFS transporter [Candidatus Dehalogenimonas loeffleri]|uniref:MFS transporter n=1 Tax=Candidatus Dehalogenimonas loeffleri TaxID=3127115 RepID=A0ABZ2J7M8_9CHLR
MLASSSSFILWSSVSIALPAIQESFGSNVAGLQWVVNAHLLTLAALLLIGGALGDRYGRRKIFLIGMSVFAAGAIASGFASSISQLILLQALQGVGSALMVPQSLAIINVCFRDTERGRAIGLWAGVSGGIAALGPWLGGWLVETSGWPVVFWMVLPVIGLAMVVTVRFVPENQERAAKKLDWPGTIFIFLGLLGIAFGLIAGPNSGWGSPLVLSSLFLGGASLFAFIIMEKRTSAPLIPLGLFKNPLVFGANVVTLLLYFAFNGVILFSVLNLQQIQGYSPSQTGLGLLPPTIIITLLAAPAGALADKFGPRPQMIGGPLVAGLGIALLMTGGTDAAYFRHFLPGLIVIGIGMAMVIAPLTKSALTVNPGSSGAASGVNNAIARTAGLLAVAVLGAFMLLIFTPTLRQTIQSSALSPTQQTAILSQSDRLGGIVIPADFSESAKAASQNAISGSYIISFRWTMGLCFLLVLSASAVSYYTIEWKNQYGNRIYTDRE